MPGLSAQELVVGANGKVNVAPVGTALPASATATLNTAFRDIGYINEDGVTFTDGKDIEDVNAWQSFYPIRKIVTSKNSSVEFAMRQWNPDTMKLAFGGGTVDVALNRYVPPAPGDIDERVLIIDWQDGTENWRLIIPRGIVSGEVSANIVRTAAADLPITFEATPSGAPNPADMTTQPWFILTDSSAFVT